MDPRPEEFEKLRRLLALKRYERPPAGCLDDVRQATLLALRRARAAEQDLRSAAGAAGWWRVWWEALAPRPLLAGALGVVVCALVIAAVFQAEQLELPSGWERSSPAWNPVPATPAAMGLAGATPSPGLTASHPLLVGTNRPTAVPLFEATPGASTLFQPPLLDVQRVGAGSSTPSNVVFP